MKYLQTIKDLRIKNNLTAQDIAVCLNITSRTYSNYEKGKTKIPLRHLIALCEYYNLSADYILGLTDDSRLLSKK